MSSCEASQTWLSADLRKVIPLHSSVKTFLRLGFMWYASHNDPSRQDAHQTVTVLVDKLEIMYGLPEDISSNLMIQTHQGPSTFETVSINTRIPPYDHSYLFLHVRMRVLVSSFTKIVLFVGTSCLVLRYSSPMFCSDSHSHQSKYGHFSGRQHEESTKTVDIYYMACYCSSFWCHAPTWSLLQ